jgi:hypothetical protein
MVNSRIVFSRRCFQRFKPSAIQPDSVESTGQTLDHVNQVGNGMLGIILPLAGAQYSTLYGEFAD